MSNEPINAPINASINAPIIECNNLCYAYDNYIALRQVTFTVSAGETVVLQGPNGCGKSTLLKLLNGLLFPAEGTFRFQGKDITEKALKDKRFAKEFHQKVGFIFQDSSLQLFTGSVEEEIAFGPRQMGLSEEAVTQRVNDVLQLTGLTALRDRAPYHLSGGEKKKTAIACILSMNPEVLVLDEPLAGLDTKTQQWLVSFLKELQSAGKTLIISTHNNALAEELGHRFIRMNDNHTIEAIVENN